MKPGSSGYNKARNIRKELIDGIGWWPCKTDEEIFTEWCNMVLAMYSATGGATNKIAEFFGLTPPTIRRTLADLGIEAQKPGRQATRYVFIGDERVTLLEAARRTGIKYQTFISAINRNMSTQEAYEYVLASHNKIGQPITFKGKVMPLAHACKRAGVSQGSVYWRVNKRKLTHQEAFNQTILEAA